MLMHSPLSHCHSPCLQTLGPLVGGGSTNFLWQFVCFYIKDLSEILGNNFSAIKFIII